MMGRKATEVTLAEKPAIEGELVTADLAEVSQFAQIAQSVSINQMRFSEWIGVRKGLSLVQKLVTVTDFKMLAEIKDTKQYKGLQVFGSDGKPVTVTTWEYFCESQGLSREHVDEGIRNLAAFGEAFLETSLNMGVGFRDLRKLRKLPDDMRGLVINGEALKSLDRESLVDFIEEQSVRHAKDKQSLQQLIDDQTASLTDKDAVIVQKTAKIEELVEAKNRREALTGAELHAELERDLTEATLVATGTMMVLRARIDDIRCLDKLPKGLYVACANSLQRIVCEAMAIATDYGIQLTLAAELEGDDSFDDPNAGEDVNADWVEQVK